VLTRAAFITNSPIPCSSLETSFGVAFATLKPRSVARLLLFFRGVPPSPVELSTTHSPSMTPREDFLRTRTKPDIVTYIRLVRYLFLACPTHYHLQQQIYFSRVFGWQRRMRTQTAGRWMRFGRHTAYLTLYVSFVMMPSLTSEMNMPSA